MIDDEQRDFGELLRRRRLASGLTQEALAGRAGLSVRGISDLERGARRVPRKSTLALLADALQLAPDERLLWDHKRRESTLSRSQVSVQRDTKASERRMVFSTPLTSLIGRERELDDIKVKLADPSIRLVTLTDTGGIGKTRLAFAVADEIASQFRDGVFLVSLSQVQHPAAVVEAIVATLDVRSTGTRPMEDEIASALQTQQILLVLDNFEHVTAAASIVVRILEVCPGLTALVTSRTPLGVRGEHQFLVGPLTLPSPEPSADAIRESAAGRLLLDRAQQHAPDFELTDENASELATVCNRLEGLPLAIELAAPWLRVLSPQDLARHLRQRLPLLTGGLQDLPARQRTLRDTIQWSYDLLGNDERRVLRHLSTFVGGWTINAAGAVVGDEDPVLLNRFRRLSDQSLIERRDAHMDTSRYGMLEVIREFGLEQSRECGEISEAKRRHAAYFLRFAACVEKMVLGATSSMPLDLIDADFANLRAAFDWFVEVDDAESALRIASGLKWYWVRRGSLTEARSWLEAALAMSGSVRGDARAAALNTAGIIAAYQGDAARSTRLHTDALRWFEAENDQYGIAFSLHGLARASQVAGNLDQACALNEQSLRIFRQLDVWIGVAGAAINLAVSLRAAADDKRPTELALEALSVAQEHGDAAFQSICLNVLAERALTENDLTHADGFADRSLALNRRMQTSRHSITGLEVKAAIALNSQRLDQAVMLFGAAARMRQRVGFPAGDRWKYRNDVELLQRTLGEVLFDTAWSSGERMSVSEAIDFALAH